MANAESLGYCYMLNGGIHFATQEPIDLLITVVCLAQDSSIYPTSYDRWVPRSDQLVCRANQPSRDILGRSSPSDSIISTAT